MMTLLLRLRLKRAQNALDRASEYLAAVEDANEKYTVYRSILIEAAFNELRARERVAHLQSRLVEG